MVLIMKRVFKIYIIGCLLLFSDTVAFGQKGKLRYADQQFELSNFAEAAQGYERAFDKKATYRAAKGAARSYSRLAAYQDAHKWWNKTIDFEESDPEDYSKYISSLHSTGNLEELKAALTGSSLSSGKENIHLDSIRTWYANPRPIKLIGWELNSSSADYGIAFDQEGNIYFSSDRGAVSSSGKKSIRVDGATKFSTKHHDMTGRDFIKIYKEEEKNQVVSLRSPVPQTYHFADPYFMEDQPVVFYTLTRDLGKVRKKRNYTINPEIYFSTINEKGELTDFTPFPYNSALEHGMITPFVDEGEKKVYFSSNRAGGLGGYDLYYVTYDEEWNFGSPVNLGPSINTFGDERDPFVYENTLYFASDGLIGLGGFDIFQAQHTHGSFTGIRNLGLPYNSPQDDYAFRRGREGKLYLSSNRADGKGSDDIYKVEDLYRQFIASVTDCEGTPIAEGLEVRLIQKDNGVAIQHREEANGVVSADLSPDADFQLDLSKAGYFSIRDNTLTTKGLDAGRLEREYVMKKIPYKTVVLEELIYYNFDDSMIRPDAEPVVLKIAEIMKKYTFLEIVVRSHTDSWASDEYNEVLSQKRANAVRDYLGKFGIARSRVRSEWYGEQQLVNDCGDGVPCPASAHQQNRRSELILMAFPDESKTYEFPKELEGLDLFKIEEFSLPLDCQ